jgi:putative tryptophan/tyrosine transport system substrate-binding protein
MGMNKQRLTALTVFAFAALSGAAAAQTLPKVYHLGLLGCGPPPSDTNDVVAGLIRGLTQRGYMLDRNVMFERRGAQFHFDRLPGLVDELVANRVDVIVALCYPAAAAAEQGTKTIPIVSAGTSATGLVNSLSRPGGNLTGMSDLADELAAKRLQLLKEMVPPLRRVAMLYNATDLGMTQRYQVSAAAAQVLGLTVLPLGVGEPEGFDEAFAAMTRDPPDGLFMVTDALTSLNRRRVFDFATAHRMPAMYEYEPIVRDGGLMSYGPDMGELQGHVAGLIERILKGAKPAELPFEQPTLFRFVINLKTVKALGLEIPAALLARADEVIE